MVASLSLALALGLISSPFEEGTLLTYKGTFLPVKVDQANAGKTFELAVLMGPESEGSQAVYWYLTDSTGTPIPWHKRFGKLNWSTEARSIEGDVPGFHFEHASGSTPVNIAPPLPLFEGELKSGATWKEGSVAFEVQEGDAVEGQATFDIVAGTLIGRKRTLTLDQNDHRIYGLRENVFVGQGEEHLLRYQLAGVKKLDRDTFQRTIEAFHAWATVREEATALPATGKEASRKPNRAVADMLPALKKQSADTPLALLDQTVASQIKTDDEQSAAASAMRSRAIGKELPDFELKDTANKAWSSDDLKGKVVVLHFWSYRDENLREPYGQVGYLDYLARRHDAAKVQVLGIAVPAENAEEGVNPRIAVRRFRDFMNVSYPILIDDAALLKKFGNVSQRERQLPLFVVIEPSGKVVEYKTGLYDVKRDEGLAELEATIKKAAATSR